MTPKMERTVAVYFANANGQTHAVEVVDDGLWTGSRVAQEARKQLPEGEWFVHRFKLVDVKAIA